ncbi:hypothetical protein SPHINGO391_450035 [Sphingomonas aurantiaca]|uniref:Uncharacterized protein n=1 Tax=Sphingomonas aurantiaca TaxID=185949 RepID=A0A5E7ZDG2_9SPHN|nr:hypothetical protein SPHINGO391_450035 [Sphingomonas aurantiaca]
MRRCADAAANAGQPRDAGGVAGVRRRDGVCQAGGDASGAGEVREEDPPLGSRLPVPGKVTNPCRRTANRRPHTPAVILTKVRIQSRAGRHSLPCILTFVRMTVVWWDGGAPAPPAPGTTAV